MNPLHYPDLDRCQQLTKIGFPETEKYWVYNSVEDYFAIQTKSFLNDFIHQQFTKSFLNDFIHQQFGDNTTDGKEYVCPSMVELLDVIPKEINYEWQIYSLDIQKVFDRCIEFSDTPPNSFSDLVLGLHENGYRFVDGKLTLPSKFI